MFPILNITVCDDEAVFIDIISDELKESSNDLHSGYRFYGFTRSIDFLNSLENNEYVPHIVFLDINMPEPNGKAVALRLKQLYPKCQLIFITAHEEEIYNAFDYNANGFISKYDLSARLHSNIIRAVRNVEDSDPKCVSLNIIGPNGRSELHNIPLSSIVYIECIMKKAYINLANGSHMRIKCNLWRDVVSCFSQKAFIIPHQNYIVNMDYIRMIGNEELELTKDNTRISISKHRRKEFIKEYTDYINFREKNMQP